MSAFQHFSICPGDFSICPPQPLRSLAVTSPDPRRSTSYNRSEVLRRGYGEAPARRPRDATTGLAHAPEAPAECPNIGHRLPTTRNAVIWPPLSAFSLAISACQLFSVSAFALVISAFQLFSVSAFALVGSVASSGLIGDQGKARFIDWWPLAISACQHFSISAFVL